MAELSVKFTELFWQSALGLIPLAIIVGLVIRFLPCRPATRHTLWLTLIAWLLVSPWLPTPPKLSKLDWQASTEQALANNESITHDVSAKYPAASLTVSPADETRPDDSDQTDSIYVPKVDSTWAAKESTVLQRTTPDRDDHTKPSSWQQNNWTSFPRFAARPVQDPMDMLARGTGAGGLHSDFTKPETVEHKEPIPTADDQLNLPREHITQSPDAVTSENEVDRAIQNQAQPFVLSSAKRQNETELPAQGLIYGITTSVNTLIDRILAYRSAVPAWVSTAAAIRDSILSLPPIPYIVWVSGIALVVIMKLASLVYFLRRVRSSIDAPRSVRDLVSETATQLGLKNPPKTLMTEAKISPMVWCGRRPLLILPRALWQQLDRESKRAVICHELAHIRRKDHWVAWLETVVGAVYWWHPMVWWVRAKLHVEAENCCDAWVTWLFPTERRAYAGALLATKKYVGMNESRAPVAGMQMTSGRAGRFSRRLTMVMTQSIVPRLSMPGLALAVALALSSWLTAPAWSCPEEPASAKPVKTVKLVSDEQAPAVVMVTTPTPDVVSETNDSSQTAYTYLVTSDDQNKTDHRQAPRTYTNDGESYIVVPDNRQRESLERRLEELERQLAELLVDRLGNESPAPSSHRLKAGLCGNCTQGKGCKQCSNSEPYASCAKGASCPKCAKPVGKSGASATVGSTGQCGSCAKAKSRSHSKLIFGHARRPRAPRRPREARSRRAPLYPNALRTVPAPRAPAVKQYLMPHVEPMTAPQFFAPYRSLGLEGSFKRYELSTGKLEALTKLMSRSDVPIIIKPSDGYIEVQGGPAVQNLFRAFVDLIEPGEETTVEYKLSKGKLKALINLMGRSDIPVLIEPTGHGINVHGNALQQSTFAAFVDAISGTNQTLSLFTPDSWLEIAKREKVEKRAKRHRHKHEARLRKSNEREIRRTEKLERKTKERAHRSMKRQQRQAEKLARKVEQLKRIREHKHQQQQRRREIEQKLHQSIRTNVDVESLHEQLHEHLAELLAEIPSEEVIESITQALQAIEVKNLDFHKQREIIESQAQKLKEQARIMAERAIEFADKAQGLEDKSYELDSQADDLGDRAQDLQRVLEETKDDDTRAKVLAEHAAVITQADEMHSEVNELASNSDELADNSRDFEEQSQAYAVLAEFLLDTAQSFFDKQTNQ